MAWQDEICHKPDADRTMEIYSDEHGRETEDDGVVKILAR